MNAADLNALSKDALVELHRAAFGTVGDYARTPKAEYVAKLSTLAPDALAEAIAKAQPIMKQPAAPAMVPDDAARQLLSIVRSLAGEAINEERVREIVADAVANLEPKRETIVVHPDRDPIKIKGHAHPALREVLAALAAGLNVLLVGPAGCGKTHLAQQAAEAMGYTFGALHCTAGASESQLTGWLLPVGESGTFKYVPSQFVTLYSAGRSVSLLDEIDAADPNMLLVINAALANGHMHIPHRVEEPTIARGPGACIIAAANTYGTGADMIYAGRNQLDAATLDRFYVITMDYDREFERQIAPADVCEWAWALREKVNAAKLRRVVSTRTIQKAAAMVAQGYTLDQIKPRLLSGWTRDELAKVGA